MLAWPSRIAAPLPPFLAESARVPTVRNMLRALRTRIRRAEATGDLCYTPYDTLLDGLWQLWPALPLREKRRFLQHMRPWHDSFQFRSQPGTRLWCARPRPRATCARAIACDADGMLRIAMQDRGAPCEHVHAFDAVVNCTGLDLAVGVRHNTFLSELMQQGLISVDPSGVGLTAALDCRAIAADGHAHDALRVVVPSISGRLVDQMGAEFLAAQIHRALPDWLATVAALQAPQAQTRCSIAHATPDI